MKLTINKQELDFVVGLGFLGELLDNLDMGLDDLLIKIDKNPFKYIPLMMYNSAKYSLELEDKEVEFTKADFFKWIDDDGAITDKNVSVIKFVKLFNDSIFKDVPKEDETPSKSDEVKKK